MNMKKATIYDIIVIVLLAIILVLVNEFDSTKELFRFRYIGFIILYFIGRYISKVIYKSDKE
jgi:Kef-type K+ transport system membrane component KefB